MNKSVFALVICLMAQVGSLYAACKTDACKRAMAWKHGFTAVVLNDDITAEDYASALDAVKANNGIVAIESARVLLGWIPPSAAAKVRSARGVGAVLNDGARPSRLPDHPSASALRFYENVMKGTYEDIIERGLTVDAPPLTGCVAQKPLQKAISQEQPSGAPQTTPSLRVEIADQPLNSALSSIKPDEQTSADPPGTVAAEKNVRSLNPQTNFWGRTPYQNPSMTGRVTVQVFILDSDGTKELPPPYGPGNMFTWPFDQYNAAQDQIYGAFTFWANQAAMRGVTLSFYVDFMDPHGHRMCRCTIPTPTGYEPIAHNSTDDYLWVNDALSRYGYGLTGNFDRQQVYEQNDALNLAERNKLYGPFDASFSVYLIYNPPPARDVFLNNQRAYAWPDGPLTMLLWNSGGWGPDNIGLVLTHETGHIFWACDEYYEATDGTGCTHCGYCFPYWAGPRTWTTNMNCESQVGTCDALRSCMMRHSSYDLCPHTPPQIGW